jgi:hypothetical protein
MTQTRTALLLALLIGGMVGVPLLAGGGHGPFPSPATPAASYAPAPDVTAPPASQPLNGVDVTGLTPGQITTAGQILGENRCNCGCGMTLAECRSKDPTCTRSLSLARQVVKEIREGKDRSTVQGNVAAALAKAQTPPVAPPSQASDPKAVFRIDTHGSPYKGFKGAGVTIAEFSDYQ